MVDRRLHPCDVDRSPAVTVPTLGSRRLEEFGQSSSLTVKEVRCAAGARSIRFSRVSTVKIAASSKKALGFRWVGLVEGCEHVCCIGS